MKFDIREFYEQFSSNFIFHINRKNLAVFFMSISYINSVLLFGKDLHKQLEARFSETETNAFLGNFLHNYYNTYSCAE